jgi:glycerate kinase
MKILIAPGAFKHSLTASTAAEAIARGLRHALPQADLPVLPIADGGNGTLDAFLAQGGQRVTVAEICDPLMRPITADYGHVDDGRTAVIEMALASGLELLTTDEQNPMAATTYGTGQLMRHALAQGATRFIVGMGGSATVDGGAGCLRALGVNLLDSNGQPIAHGGGGLADLARIDASALDPRWQSAEVIIASDVENPTLGDNGAAAVFGPQKGATPEQVSLLEANLRRFFTITRDTLGVDVLDVPGGGAAGAFSAGLMAFLGGRIESGIDLILEHAGFETHLQNTDLVVTGEGQIDTQTVQGKGPIGVARLASQYNVPTVAIVGGLNADDAVLHDAEIQAVLPIVTGPMSLDEALNRAEELVERAALRLGYLLEISGK